MNQTLKNTVLISMATMSLTAMAGAFDAKQSWTNPTPAGDLKQEASELGDKILVNTIQSFQDKGMTKKSIDKLQREEEDFIKMQIKKQRKLKVQNELKTQYVEKDKKVVIKEKQKYATIYIPFKSAITTLKFDNPIKENAFIPQPGVTIKGKGTDSKVLQILNENPNLDLSLNIEFVNGKEIVLKIKVGDASAKRYIDYKIMTDSSSISAKTLFVKETKARNIHRDFNNKAIHMILSRIVKNDFYNTLRENIIVKNLVLADEKTILQGLYGDKEVDYKLVLNNVFESPYVTSKSGDREKKRLVMLEMTITNNNLYDTLVVNEILVGNRFDNFVAMWLGDLDNKQNYLRPSGSLKFLVVIEDAEV